MRNLLAAEYLKLRTTKTTWALLGATIVTTALAGGLAANNVVAHCNDAGIDVNRSSQIALAHNTLINTVITNNHETISSQNIE